MDMPFHLLDGATIDAPFMDNLNRHFIAMHDGFKVLKLQHEMQQQDDHLHSHSWTRSQ
jgi:hypothetical protein